MTQNIDSLAEGSRKLKKRITQLEADLAAAREDFTAIERAEAALLRLNSFTDGGEPLKKHAPVKFTFAKVTPEKSEVNRYILRCLTGEATPLAQLIGRIMEAGYKPRGKYFEATARKSLERLVRRGRVAITNDGSRNLYSLIETNTKT